MQSNHQNLKDNSAEIFNLLKNLNFYRLFSKFEFLILKTRIYGSFKYLVHLSKYLIPLIYIYTGTIRINILRAVDRYQKK